MIDSVATILEIVISVITINGIVYGIFHKFIKIPLKEKYNYVMDTLKDTNDIAKEVQSKMTDALIPFMKSFQDEFSTNSGKSIKDRITRIDNTIKKEELRNKLLSDSLLTIGSYECDAGGGCVWANKALCEMFGLSLAEMMGSGWLSAICEDDRMDSWLKWLKAIELNIPYESVYTVCNIKTGEHFSCQSQAVAHRDAKGIVLGFYGTVRRI
jgi:PAS domain S-box-containing protein